MRKQDRIHAFIHRRHGKTGCILWHEFYSRYSVMPNEIIKAMMLAMWHKILRGYK